MPYKRHDDSTPICRCRVLYLGSAVPHVTKDGLQGIQEPLRELYPEQGALGARGIDSWLSVWSNGLLLENVDENHKKVTRFFPIDSLHYCAAVRYVLVPEKAGPGGSLQLGSTAQPRFLPLDSPFARSPNPTHPPLFAAILRRTTGIKVLECHAFICKREVAANALVRCCFHAYADSSYAKQIEGGGSLYSTLNGGQSNSTAVEKVEGWRRLTNGNGISGSTSTLNTLTPQNGNHHPQLRENGETANLELSESADDLSIYNGDENHKVWAGSNKDLSSERDVYETSTVTRKTNRPRQVMSTPPPPPPPPPPVAKESPKKVKDKRRKKTSEGYNNYYTAVAANNGITKHNGNGSSASVGGTMARGYGPKGYHGNGVYNGGTMLRPQNGFPPPPIMMIPTTLPHPRKISGGSYHRPMLMPVPPPLPPHLLPPPMQPMYVQTGKKLPKHGMPAVLPPMSAMEEPIYMPSARPMSPVASYQPGHFPHEAYLMQHYATTDAKSKNKNNKARKKGRKSNEKLPPPPPPRVNGESIVDEGTGENDSIYGTGIYKRKGHMNERAFSYSIRQEHRSRSHGSLANLKFATPPNGAINKEELKKEREIMQMMRDLELSGDELERSEVPPNLYQQSKVRPSKHYR